VSRFYFHVHVGPVIVDETAKRMLAAGIADVRAGTEHVYGHVVADDKFLAVERMNTAAGFRLLPVGYPLFEVKS
jgi:hypothetical protein